MRNLRISKEKSRELRFRIWDKIHNHWVVENSSLQITKNNHAYFLATDVLKYESKNIITPNVDDKYINQSEDYVIQQFTELKDKNDKKIYEGDIIKDRIFIGEIRFSSLEGWIFGDYTNFHYNFYSDDVEIENLEVIGNIFENPELLK